MVFFFTSVYDFAYQILADILSIDRLLVYKKWTAKICLYFFLGGGGVDTTTYFTPFFESRKSSDEDEEKENKETKYLRISKILSLLSFNAMLRESISCLLTTTTQKPTPRHIDKRQVFHNMPYHLVTRYLINRPV